MDIRALIRIVIEEEIELLEEAKPKIPEKFLKKAEGIYAEIQAGTPPGLILHSKQLPHLKEGKVTYSIQLGLSHRMIYNKIDNTYFVMSHEDYNRWWKINR